VSWLLRLVAIPLLVWALGFGIFMLSLGKPLERRTTDAIVVLTGAQGRIDHGVALMRQQAAKRMLVSGVGADVRPSELAARYPGSGHLFKCCIDLGHQAVDTRSNADETAEWVRDHGFKSVRLVTSDWHMPRAILELRNALGTDAEIFGDGVPSHPGYAMLLREYHKFLLRRIALLLGWG